MFQILNILSNASRPGGLHKLEKEDLHFRGVQLFEAARIKTICADVSRVVRENGKQYRELSKTNSTKSVNKISRDRD